MDFVEKMNKLLDAVSDDLIKENLDIPTADNSMDFKMIENYGKLSTGKNPIVFSMVDWSGNSRYDLRRWNAEITQPYKGITFTEEEMIQLKKSLGRCNYTISPKPIYIYEMGLAKGKIHGVLCTLSETETKDTVWRKQDCIVDWGYGLKYDFRRWSTDYKKCSKGISLGKSEMKELVLILKRMDCFSSR